MFRRARILFLITTTLARKYTKALTLGFVSGLILSLLFWRFLPKLDYRMLSQAERIGLVGEFTPATLPLTIQNQISGGLTKITDDGTVTGALASAWTATDSGKTFIFTIRPDMQWHTGQQVVSQDINYNIRGVEFSTPNTFTIRAKLNAPYSPFPAVVSKPLFLKGLSGWGEYSVTSLDLNGDTVASIKISPIKDPTKKAKSYHFFKTEAAAITAYKLGEIDRIEDLSQIGELEGRKGTQIEKKVNYNRIVALYFNVSEPFLSEKDTRHALAYATPLRSDVERAISPISKTSWAYTDKIKKFTYDEKEAKALLGDVSKASESASLTISTFIPYLSDAELIKDSWTKLGIQTDIRVVASVPPDYQVLLTAQDLPPDPDQYPFWHSTQNDTNITNFVNVKIDKLLEDGRQEIDEKKRALIYSDFQRRLVEETPAAFLYYAASYTVHRSP